MCDPLCVDSGLRYLLLVLMGDAQFFFFFFFNDTATTEIYTLSLHDALPISLRRVITVQSRVGLRVRAGGDVRDARSEEHTSELQSLRHLVCRLLLEKKKKNKLQRSGACWHDAVERRSCDELPAL